MEIKHQGFWNIVFILFFMGLFGLGVLLILRIHNELPTQIPVFDFVLLILATFRIIRLVTKDHVMQFFRDWFTEESEGPFCTIHKLISCPWCFGLWAALMLCIAYFATPYAWFAILVFAIGGVASLLQIIAASIGLNIDKLKKQIQSS